MLIKTDAQVRAAKLRPNEQERMIAIPGHRGLCLRIRQQSKHWLFRWKVDGKRRLISLGEYPTVGLASAYRAANEIRTQIANGRNPQLERQVARMEAAPQRTEEALPSTVNNLFKDWQAKQLATRKDEGESVRKAFCKDVFPFIGELPLNDIRKVHIAGVLDRAKSRGVNRSVGVLLSSLRQMFRFAISRDYIDRDPTFSLRKKDFGIIETERSRTLDQKEIVLLAKNLVIDETSKLAGEARLKNTTKLAILIQLSTCCRIGELVQARWSDIDLANGTWKISQQDSQTKRHQQTVFLSDFSLARFTELKAITGNSSWVLPDSRRNGVGPVCSKTISKQVADRQREVRLAHRSSRGNSLALPGGKWTMHDLRRTGATLMGDLGVSSDVIERVLNHSDENKIRRTYQRQQLLEQKKAAWQTLGGLLAKLMAQGMCTNLKES